MDRNSIDISIVLLTFNQEKFIGEALDSVLAQQFNGTLELIVADDSSTDATYKIVVSKLKELSIVNRSYSNKMNIGLARNFEKAFLRAEGKYIAYLEGDDYWTDTYKLQKQYSFLERNPEFSMAFHDFVTVDETGMILSDSNLSKPWLRRNRSQKDMITGCLIHQNSALFRNVVDSFPNAFFKSKNFDTFFIAYLARWGPAGYVDCAPLCYRMVIDSLWSSLSTRKRDSNALITYWQILSVSECKFYIPIVVKIISKLKMVVLNKIDEIGYQS